MNVKQYKMYVKLLYTEIVLMLINFLNALYLTYNYYTGNVYCVIEQGLFDCASVHLSEYAIFLWLPVSLWGMLYHLVCIGIIIFSINNIEKEYLVSFYLPVAMIWGVIFSTYLTIVQIFLIEAFCEFCLFSAITVVISTIIALIAKKIRFGSVLAKIDFWVPIINYWKERSDRMLEKEKEI